MLKNKHMIVAMIVAPILALISYFATDYIVGEDPVQAEAGQTYSMIARSNCRYASGVCTLVNGDFEIKLSIDTELDGAKVLQVYSNQVLEGVRVALARGENELPPKQMIQGNADSTHWRTDIDGSAEYQADGLRVAMLSTGVVFYASVGTDFFTHDERYPNPIVN